MVGRAVGASATGTGLGVGAAVLAWESTVLSTLWWCCAGVLLVGGLLSGAVALVWSRQKGMLQEVESRSRAAGYLEPEARVSDLKSRIPFVLGSLALLALSLAEAMSRWG